MTTCANEVNAEEERYLLAQSVQADDSEEKYRGGIGWYI